MLVGLYRRHRASLRIAICIAAAAVAIAHVRADDWPEWRGKGRLGVWNETGLVDRLPATLPVTWRTPSTRVTQARRWPTAACSSPTHAGRCATR